MEDLLSLKVLQLDALREVANIGAGHAATALSQMVGETIMITVPTINIARLEEVPVQMADPDEPVAAVLMHMMGDLTGRTLLVFPKRSAVRLAARLLKKTQIEPSLSEMGQSAIKEAGNILSSAYMNALSDFMGMMLVPSVPGLVVDQSAAVITSTYLNFGQERDYVFCVETSFQVGKEREALNGHFLLLPDMPSLRAIFDAIRLP